MLLNRGEHDNGQKNLKNFNFIGEHDKGEYGKGYYCIFTIYSISNIDDISWGSRPAVNTVSDNSFKAAENFKSQKYKNFRSNFIVFWLVINLICGFVITYLSRNGQNIILFVIAWVITSVNVTKLGTQIFNI